MAGFAAAFQKDLVSEKFNFRLRRDILGCFRHGVDLLRSRLYARHGAVAYREERNSRAGSRYLDFRGVAFDFDGLRRPILRQANLRLMVLCTGRRVLRERWISRSME